MTSGARIVGVAESDLGITNMPILELQAQAISRALADAGLALSDVDGVATSGLAHKFEASVLSEYLGLQPRWIDSTSAGGASFEILLDHAQLAIAAGRAETIVISYGSNQRSGKSRTLGGMREDHVPLAEFEMPYGPLLPISAYALSAQRHIAEYGTRREAFAEVAVAAREWALMNPVAYRYGQGPLTIEEVLESEPISDPLNRYDCCLVTDGGGAIIVTSAERARDLPKPSVAILGSAYVSTHRSLASMPSLTRTGAYDTAARAYAQANLRPADMDVIEIYDSFTITVLLTLEALGFCGPGESGDFVSDGKLRPGGGFALNTNGGGLSYCHPGMYGIFLIVEAVRQLRDESRERQVADAEFAICHATGGYLNTHATVILGRD